MLKVREIADLHKVTVQAVYLWIADGLQFQTVKNAGRKPYKIIDPEKVKLYLDSKVRG